MHTAWQLGSSAMGDACSAHVLDCAEGAARPRGEGYRARQSAQSGAQRLAQLALFRERALCLREAATLLEEGIAGLRAQARIPLEFTITWLLI